VSAEKRTDERRWQQTDTHARPKDGEKAQVRRRGAAQTLIMIFRQAPIARWESLDDSHVYEFEFFEEWRRL